MKILHKIPSWLRSKFLLTGIFFAAWMVFFAEKDIRSVWARKEKLNELQKSEKHLLQQIQQARTEQAQLSTDVETIEKYAREKFLMKRDNEDLFIVPEDSVPAK